MYNTQIPFLVRVVFFVYSSMLTGVSMIWFVMSGVRYFFRGPDWHVMLARLGRGPRMAGLPKKSLWLHAVSAGEVAATAIMLPALRRATGNERPIVLTCATTSGMAMAKKRFSDDVICIQAPLDTPGTIRRFYDTLDPVILAVAEIEIWPNLFMEAVRRGIPLMMYNARMPDRDFKRYQRFRWVFRHVLSAVRTIGAQTAEDAARYCAIGAATDRITVTGNIKNDQEYHVPDGDGIHFDVSDGRPVILLASSHPGEEQAVIESVLRHGARLVLAPRHVTRARRLEAIIARSGFSCEVRSKMRPDSSPVMADILLLDTFGELMLAAAQSSFVIMGGSFTRKIQGHNPMEAAALSKPVILGPYMDNFRDVRDALVSGDGAVVVAGYRELPDAVSAWVENPHKAHLAGQKARIVLENLRGASSRTANIIATHLTGAKKFDSSHLCR